MFGKNISDRLAGTLAHEQKSERECLCKRSRKQRVEVRSGVAACFGMRVEDVPELLPYLQQRVARVAALVNFGQAVLHDAADEPSGMCQKRG